MTDDFLRSTVQAWNQEADGWFVQSGRRVAIVIPSYRDARLLDGLFEGLLRHTPPGRCDVIICDDHSDDPAHAAHLEGLARRHEFVTVIAGDDNRGFAVNVNRGLSLVPPGRDVILMNSDVVPLDGWLAALQYSLHLEPADIIAPKMLFADGTIQFCGGMPSRPGTRGFAHNYRGRALDFPPATVRADALFVTGAVFYITAECFQRLGLLDERFPWAFEDADYCVRCWSGGGTVAVEPRSVVYHLESQTIGEGARQRSLGSSQWFWEKQGAFFQRSVMDERGMPHLVVVTRDLGRDPRRDVLCARITSTAKAGFNCEVWNIGGTPHFVDGRVRGRGFDDLAAVEAALGEEDAIKLCTGWHGAAAVWRTSIRRGVPAYWVGGIELGADAVEDARIAASYRPEFTILAEGAETAMAVSAAGYDRPVAILGDDSFVSTLRHLAAHPILGEGRAVGS